MLREIVEKKLNASAIVKIFKNEEDWGELGDFVSVKKGNIEVLDLYFYGGEKQLDYLKREWSKGGTYYDYLYEEYGVELNIIDEFNQPNPDKKYKKLTSGSGGIVGIILKVK